VAVGFSATMLAKTLRELRAAPILLPAAGALALLLWFAADDGGYPLLEWAPGGLIALGLLAVATVSIGRRGGRPSRATILALACLLGYSAFSYLSMLWAAAPGAALEGGDRTLLYAALFALFACFGLTGRAAALWLCAYVLALTGLALYVFIHLDQLGANGLGAAMPGGRLVFPVGYVNATAAQWMIGAFAALMLARSGALHPLLRGMLAACAALLCDLALLSLSRGALLASAILLVLIFALFPQRLRTYATLIAVALGVGIAVPALLRVGERVEALLDGEGTYAAAHSALGSALLVSVLAAALTGALVAGIAFLERARTLTPARRARARRGVAVLALGTLLALVGGGIAVAGNPIARVEHAWRTFASERGYEANSKNTNRLVAGLGSNRYDFFRVAINQFLDHPLLGIGSENYLAAYLKEGRSEETPRYPHSVELRLLAETGIIGTLIALVGFFAALLAAGRAMRPRSARAGGSDALAPACAAAALAGFGYWVVHGSADWFYEYAGLGASAFALLGMACALDRVRPRALPAHDHASVQAEREAPPVSATHRGERAGASRRVAVTLALGVGVLGALALALPWLSTVELHAAARVWRSSPARAYASLEEASSLDPWSSEPDIVAGTIAEDRGQYALAVSYFRGALARTGNEEYAVLELGALASARGQPQRALSLLERALALYPRSMLARQALAEVRSGRRIELRALNNALLGRAQGFQ
jgi:O-antigen ligase/Tfp pilus assembly protein PilF